MSSHQPIRIAIVEDDATIRKGWVNVLKRWPAYRVTGEYRTGEEALESLPLAPPDFVLMDINLPGMSGIECTRELKRLIPDVNILMLTVFGDWDRIFDALRAGAVGYLLKRIRPAALKAALEDAAAGGAPMTPYIARQVIKYFQNVPSPAAAARKSPEVEYLSPKECQIMEALSEGSHYKEIADALGISIDTVRTHLRRIYHKLHVHSRTAAVVKFLAAKNG
jgi:DNA-binding NarL/FixJ family response regulator